MALAGRTPRKLVVLAKRLGLSALGAVALAGCANALPPATAERAMPAMPSMGPPRNAPNPEIPESEIIARALRSALSDDVAAALRILDLATGVAERASAATKLVSALASQDPPKAARLAFGLPSGPTRSSAIETVALAWTQRDPDEALRWSLGIEDPATANVARRAVAGVLLQQNPRSVLDRMKMLPAGRSRDEMVAVAAGAWARMDPDGASFWLREQPNDAVHEHLASTVAFEIAQVSPARAIEVAGTLPAGRNRWLVFSGIAQTWVALDRDAAILWANQLQPGEARDAAIAGINTGLGIAPARRAPAPPGIPGIPRNRSAYAVGSESDPPAFALWMATQPRTMTREEAILEYVRQRSALDSGSIGSWLAGLAGEPARQRAMDIYFQEVLRGSPAAAANWIGALPSSDRSDERVETIARQWLQTDPSAAAAWLRETNLPRARQEEILRQVPR